MKFQLSPLVLLSAATSVLASEDLAVSRSTQTVNNHDDLDRLQPKMNGKPVVPGESSPFFRRKHPRFSETVKSKAADQTLSHTAFAASFSDIVWK